MENQPSNYRPQPPQQQLGHQIQTSHPGQQGGQQGGPYQNTQAMRGQQNISRIRFTPQTNLMYQTNLVPSMYTIQAGQIRMPAYYYGQTGDSVSTSHVAVKQQVPAQYIAKNNGIPKSATHPQTPGASVAYQVPRLQIGGSKVSYTAQQPVHISQIGQGSVNEQVHGMGQQQTQQQQQQQIAHHQSSNQQQVQQHQVQSQAIPHQHYSSRVEQPTIGPVHRCSNEGPPGASGQAKEIQPPVVRKKKILYIIDPTSGKDVIDAPEPSIPSTTAETVKEEDKKSETPEVSVAALKSSVSGSVGGSGPAKALTSSSSSTKDTISCQPAATYYFSSKTKVIETEFFNKISQANDERKITNDPSLAAKATDEFQDEQFFDLLNDDDVQYYSASGEELDDGRNNYTKYKDMTSSIRKYDRDFLLQLQSCPASNRKDLDIDVVEVLKTSKKKTRPSSSMSSGYTSRSTTYPIPKGCPSPHLPIRPINLKMKAKLSRAEDEWRTSQNSIKSPDPEGPDWIKTRKVLQNLTEENVVLSYLNGDIKTENVSQVVTTFDDRKMNSKHMTVDNNEAIVDSDIWNTGWEDSIAWSILSTFKPHPVDLCDLVKDILLVFIHTKKLPLVLVLLKDKFPGDDISLFVDLLVRQVGQMLKEAEQRAAGNLVKLLIQQNVIKTDQVMQIISSRMIKVILSLKGIYQHTRFFNSCVPNFILEIFGDESNFEWLTKLVSQVKPSHVNQDMLDDFIELIVIAASAKNDSITSLDNIVPIVF